MTPANLAIFDDHQADFGPLTDLRPACDLRTGMWTTHDRIEHTLNLTPAALIVPPALAGIATNDHPHVAINALPELPTPDWLLVSSCASSPKLLEAISSLHAGQALVDGRGRLIAAHVSAATARAWLASGALHQPPAGLTVKTCDAAPLLARPWDIQAQLEDTLRHDLLACDVPVYSRAKPGVAVAGEHPIKIAPTAKLHPMVVINAEKGPVVIEADVVLGSFAVVAGPCYIGKGTIITPHTHVRALCSIGPSCVVGGEVSAIVIQSHSNKGHAGYLGNSIVGQWVNLGADTNASNLKNTYGSVRMTLHADGVAEDSGLSKLGPIIGDYVRTAIGSRLMTGSCIHTGSMLAVSDFAPKFVNRFQFLTDDGSEAYDIEKFLKTAKHMMSRRNVNLSAAHEARLRELAQK